MYAGCGVTTWLKDDLVPKIETSWVTNLSGSNYDTDWNSTNLA